MTVTGSIVKVSTITATALLFGLGASGYAQTPIEQERNAADAGGFPSPVAVQKSTPKSVQNPGQNIQNDLQRRISVDFDRVQLGDVLMEIAQRSKVMLSYKREVLPLTHLVTVRMKDARVIDVLESVLKGTGIVVDLSDGGRVNLIAAPKSGSSATAQQGEGTVGGRVLDSATGKGIRDVTVTVVGTKISAVTNESGAFVLRKVPVGAQMVLVRAMGYVTVNRAVIVATDKANMVQVFLRSAPTQLSGVVTTATGEQRRVEVGNDITVIKVDSIVKTMPVSSLSDLLATRVPGLYAVPASGEPGAPTRIRIRGISSINGSNDPIVIVDGVQVYARQIEPKQVTTANLTRSINDKTLNTFALSPIDQIDPNSIETVEVLKGPSAVALYGSDEANGVIVITTKRGQVGPTLWSVSANYGTEYMPGTWPTNYYASGHYYYNEAGVMQCTQSTKSCTIDTLITYQMLNDPATTIFGHGTTQTYRADVRGGARGVTYALSGSMASVLGLAKLPDVDVDILRQARMAVPSTVRRPQADDKQNGTANVMMDIGRSTVSFTTMLGRQVTRGTPLSRAIAQASGFEPPRDMYGADGQLLPHGSGLLPAIPDFRKTQLSQSLRSTNSVDVQNTFGHQIKTQVTGGIDMSSRRDRAMLKTGECYVVTSACNNQGFYYTGQGAANQSNLNLRASMPLSVTRLFSVRTSIGGNYVRTTTNDLLRTAEGLPPGATSGNGATTMNSYELSSDRATAGMYVGTQIGIADRFFLPLEIRKDAGSALGSKVAPTFPRLSFSYVISDDPRFRAIPFVGALSMLRLRAAYGEAGKQPGVGATFRTYISESAVLDGIAVNAIRMAGFGNTMLKPERSREIEGGFDADLLHERVSLGVSWYRKGTEDLLVSEQVPFSAGGGGSRQMNLGDVTNSGYDVSLGVTVLQLPVMTWRSDVSVSRQRNQLTRINAATGTAVGIGGVDVTSMNVVGYPLGGTWAFPMLGYADRNHDGKIVAAEILLSDSAVYMGAPYPNFSMMIQQSATFLGQITVGAGLTYQDGLTQSRSFNKRFSRANNDPTVSLAEQAYGLHSSMTNVQTVSILRFNSLSIGWNLPRQVTRALLPNRTLRVSLQGRNLGLWSNYRGKDPSVTAGSGNLEGAADVGALPTPRVWGLTVGIN